MSYRPTLAIRVIAFMGLLRLLLRPLALYEAPRDARRKSFRLAEKIKLEIPGHLLGIPALTMPELKKDPLDFIVKRLGGDLSLFFERGHDLLGWRGEFTVIAIEDAVGLAEESLHIVGAMAGAAGTKHIFSLPIRFFVFRRNHRMKGSGNAQTHVMCNGQAFCRAHVTGRAGRSGAIVFSGDPFLAFQIHLARAHLVDQSMLGIVITLHLRMHDARMALGATLRLACLGDGELVPRMAGGAIPLASIEVDSSDAGVGPGGRVEAAILKLLHLIAVAFLATADGLGHSGGHTPETVKLADGLGGPGMRAGVKFLDLLLMTSGAILGRWNNCDNRLFVLPGIGIALLGLMAVHTPNAERGVAAVLPLSDNGGRFFLMAFHATQVLLSDHRLRFFLGKQALALDIPHGKQ